MKTTSGTHSRKERKERAVIILGTPKDVRAFICVDDGRLIELLHKAKFMPMYKDDEACYFKRTKKIERFLKEIENGGEE